MDHNQSHQGLGDQTPQKHGVTTLAKGRRRATLGKYAWFTGNTGKTNQEQPVHWQHGQSPPTEQPQHHHSSRAKTHYGPRCQPRSCNNSPQTEKTQHQVGGLWQSSNHTAGRAREGQDASCVLDPNGNKGCAACLIRRFSQTHKTSPCHIVTHTQTSEHMWRV